MRFPTEDAVGHGGGAGTGSPSKVPVSRGWSEFSVFEGLGSKQLEDERTGGVSIARSARLGVEGAEEARISDDYDDKRDDNPKECKHRSLSMLNHTGISHPLGARVKAIATCARSGDATRMAKKIDDGMKPAKERVGRKSDTINIGRGRLSAVEGRRNTLEDNIQDRWIVDANVMLKNTKNLGYME
ncbi:hypothetical protein ACSQ67_025774 [Phaseolus vulgaris]